MLVLIKKIKPELILRNYRKKKKHLSVAFFFHKALALHEFVLSNRLGGGFTGLKRTQKNK